MSGFTPPIAATAVLLALPLATWGQEGQGNDLLPDIERGPYAVRLEVVTSVAPDPAIDITHAGDQSGRLFIVSPRGVVRIFENGMLDPTPFLSAPASPPDRAMSGLAFHPGYATNGKLYVITGEAVPNGATPHYVSPQDDTSSAFDNVLQELQVSATDPDVVDPGTKRELLRVHQAHRLHNMNDLAFGGDGYLYVAMGDGGTTRQGTPATYETTAQDTQNPFGSILRIDVDTLGTNGRYGIPAQNPFAAGGGAPEIFCWGVRNPWRLGTDSVTGDVFTAVNGDFTIETVLLLELGKNYGWAVKEGSFLWDPITGNASVDPDPSPAYTAPLAEYDHRGRRAFGSSIGGFVYRGSELPQFRGKYLFLDWLAAVLIAMDPKTGGLETVPVDPTGAASLRAGMDITIGEGEDGELYVGCQDGLVLRLVRGETFAGAPAPGAVGGRSVD